MAWPTAGGFALTKEARQLEILTQIFNDRLFDKLRSTEGAAYSPSVQNSWPFSYESGGYILVTSQVRPDRVNYFYGVVKDTAADLAANSVSEDELQRAVAPMRQRSEEHTSELQSLMRNSYAVFCLTKKNNN